MSIRRAGIEALKSCFKRHRMGAVIAKGGRVLSTGYNQLRPSSLLKTKTLHCEAAAILKLLKEGRLHDLVGSSIYITRRTAGGRVGMARPCYSCHSLIQSVGISQVFYTTDSGTTEKYKL